MTSSVIQGQHPIVACARGIRDLIADVSEAQPLYMTAKERKDALVVLERTKASIAELEMRVIAASDDLAEETAARDVATWLANQVQAEPDVFRVEERLARSLDQRWHRVAAGMREGAVSRAHAVVIVDVLEDLPATVATEILASAEATLVDYARQFRPSQLRRIGRHILDVVAPEIAEEEEARRLLKEEQAAHERASLRFRSRGDGTTAYSGVMPEADFARWKTYLDAFASPRQRVDGLPGEADRIPTHRKLAHAFAALLEFLDPGRLPEHGGDATTVMVTISHEQLTRQLATAGLIDADLDAGANLSAEQARRLACNARIIPVVLGGRGEILDLGRARRIFPPALRRALKLRDKRCRAEGCSIPATWCDAHHLEPWSQGGTTDLRNAISLCNWHHHRIHDHRYDHERLPDGDVRFHRRT